MRVNAVSIKLNEYSQTVKEYFFNAIEYFIYD